MNIYRIVKEAVNKIWRDFHATEFMMLLVNLYFYFFFSSRRRHTRCSRDWSSDVCSSDLADADGNIAYLHSNFIPKRDPKFDWTKPVDGSNTATEWNGVLSFDESPNVVNPDRKSVV